MIKKKLEDQNLSRKFARYWIAWPITELMCDLYGREGFRRLSKDPERLQRIADPCIHEYSRTCRLLVSIPDDAGFHPQSQIHTCSGRH